MRDANIAFSLQDRKMAPPSFSLYRNPYESRRQRHAERERERETLEQTRKQRERHVVIKSVSSGVQRPLLFCYYALTTAVWFVCWWNSGSGDSKTEPLVNGGGVGCDRVLLVLEYKNKEVKSFLSFALPAQTCFSNALHMP